MTVKLLRLRLKLLISVFSLAIIFGGQTWAETTPLEHEKAMLVSKFAKYIVWPEHALGSAFIIGVYEDTEKYEYFKAYFKNKGVNNKDIIVRLVTTMSDAKDVNVFYISSNKRRTLTMAAKAIGGSPVLLVTENNNDINNIMIDISYNKEKSNLTFKVNDVNIANADLTLPDLSYFSDSTNNEEVLTVSPSYALQQKQKNDLLALENKFTQQKSVLEERLARQQASLIELNKKVNSSQEKSEKYTEDLKKSSERLELALEEVTKMSKALDSKNEALENLENRLQELQDSEGQTISASPVVSEDGQTLNENSLVHENMLTELTESLKKQKEITNNTAIKLANISKENNALSSYQTLFYVFVLISIIALIVAFLMWKKANNKAIASTLVPAENEALLPVREGQLIRSENFAALGYIATDITYAVGLSLVDLQEKLESNGDSNNAATLSSIVTLLDNFNLIAADQDDTEVQTFDLIAYMQKMMMLYDFEFIQSSIVYSYSGEKALTIKSIPSYIALILLNLINNSLKHGFNNEGNGEITLQVDKDAKGGAKIIYSDNGKGMNKETLKQVFTPFFTTRSDREYVGVGMSTTYDLVKNKLSGDIKIDSKEGKGTTVTITLP